MKKYLFILFSVAVCLISCNEKDNTYDPYKDWQSRNAKWFEDTVQVARLAIAQAKAVHGEEWEKHCQWRMFKSLYRSSSSQGPVTDSICVRILKHGTDFDKKGSPAFNDSVHLNYRGWLMPTYNYIGNGTEMGTVQDVFDTSYYGDYNPENAAPQPMAIKSLIEGFGTAIQHMVEDDDWMVFIPYTLGYGSKGSGKIRGYSTLQFRIHLIRWYESGTGVPGTWE